MKKIEISDNEKIIMDSVMIGERQMPYGMECLYHNKKTDDYFLVYNNSLEETTIYELYEGEAIEWAAKHLPVGSVKKLFHITFGVGVDSIINGEEFFDDYEPKTQSWSDVIETYDRAYCNLCEELNEDEIIEQTEWLMNDYQPITRIETKAGNVYEVYVYTGQD